jgi:hypothetical protein
MTLDLKTLHRCKLCRSLWTKHPNGGGWSLVKGTQPDEGTGFNGRAGACCDNVAMGDQIEAVSAPRACDKIGCDMPGEHRPRLMARSPLAPEHPCPISLSLVICDEHKATSTPDSFMTPAGWDRITADFARMNFAEPSRELLTLEWDRATAANEPRAVMASRLANAHPPKPPRNPLKRGN